MHAEDLECARANCCKRSRLQTIHLERNQLCSANVNNRRRVGERSFEVFNSRCSTFQRRVALDSTHNRFHLTLTRPSRHQTYVRARANVCDTEIRASGTNAAGRRGPDVTRHARKTHALVLATNQGQSLISRKLVAGIIMPQSVNSTSSDPAVFKGLPRILNPFLHNVNNMCTGQHSTLDESVYVISLSQYQPATGPAYRMKAMFRRMFFFWR